MATAFDAAAYILDIGGEMTHMKLQKLLYYSQAWSLVWDSAPLFDSRIQAWANGPVVPCVYQKLRGRFLVNSADMDELGDPANLTDEQKDTIRSVFEFYGHRDPQWLSDLTHMESPWKDAREGLAPGERSSREITHAAMAEYYESL